MPPFLFFFLFFFNFFSVSKVGLPLMGYTAVQNTDCYLSPCQHDFETPFLAEYVMYTTTCILNMYTTTSEQEEGCTFKDSHPKCFITTNFDKFHREAFARGGESRWCFDSMFPWYTKSKINSNGVCNYYDFIRREGLSFAIWFDIVESAFGENIHMTVKIFANVHQLLFLYGFWY